MRDLKKDLEVCNAAQLGEWEVVNSKVYDELGIDVLCVEDAPEAEFIVEACKGWPYAIERALEIEEELTRCGNTLVELTIALKNDRKRADKAEALARELVEALEMAFDLLEHHQPNWYTWAHFHQINNALGSYKEVLVDEA